MVTVEHDGGGSGDVAGMRCQLTKICIGMKSIFHQVCNISKQITCLFL